MKKLITVLLISVKICLTAQCSKGDYMNTDLSNDLMYLGNGDTLVINKDMFYDNTLIIIDKGGVLILCNDVDLSMTGIISVWAGGIVNMREGSLISVDGSMYVRGLVNILGEGSLITVNGSYADKYDTYNIDSYSDDCHSVNLLVVNGSLFGGDVNCVKSLPVELSYYSCNGNSVDWVTLSEINSSHFILMGSNDSYSWNELTTIEAQGDYVGETKYTYKGELTKYVKLIQYDYDGTSESFDIKMCENVNNNGVEILYYVNAIGQIVNENFNGVRFAVYSNGEVKKTFN